MKIVMILMLIALSIATCAAIPTNNGNYVVPLYHDPSLTMLSPFYSPTGHTFYPSAPIMHAPGIYSIYYGSVYYDSGLTGWNDMYYRYHYAPVYTYFYDWTGVRRYTWQLPYGA
jgi:hypothetical protein